MAFLDAITRLQQSSNRKRMSILIISVTVIMGSVIWLWTLQLRYTLGKKVDGQTQNQGPKESVFEPLKFIFGTAYRNALEGVKSMYEK